MVDLVGTCPNMTLADVLAKIRDGLDWISSTGRGQGHICLTREEAQYLYDHVIALIIERDELLYRLEAEQQAHGETIKHYEKEMNDDGY